MASSATALRMFVGRSWRTEEGLPHNTVMAISQTRDGYIWVGTANGLARFNGIEFKRFGLSDGLSSLYVRVLLEDRDGGLWIGTVNGISRYFKGEITTWTTREGLAGNVILGLAEDKDGTIWIATNSGVSRWQKGTLDSFGDHPVISGRYIAAVAVDHENSVWFSVSGSLLRWNGESLANPVASSPQSVSRLFCDNAGRIWAGNDSHVYCLENRTWKQFGTKDGLPGVRITSLSESSDATVWVGTVDQGLFYFREGTFHRVGPSGSLSDAAILAAIEDQNKNLWVGTRAGGLNRLKTKQLLTFTHVENGIEVAPISLAEASDGSLRIAALGRGIYSFDRQTQKFVRQSMPAMPSALPIGAILITRNDSLWWGSGWLANWKDGKLQASYSSTPELRGDSIRCLLEDRHAGLWMGTRDGRLLLLRDRRFAVFTNGLPRVSLTTLVQQEDGTLWVGSYGGGVSRLKDGATTVFTREHGLGSDLIRALCLDSRSNLWIGTEGGGLSCFRDGVLRTFGAEHGIADDSVVQILEDDRGDLWLGTFRGIYQISREELDDLVSDRSSRVFARRFDRSDGMLSEQCTAGFGACLKTRDGLLCFSTDRGLVVIDPNQIGEKSTQPVVRLESLMIPGISERLEPPHDVEIPSRHGRLEFQYAALFFAAPERVQFRYRLQGLDTEWIEAGGRRSAYYNNLPPGRYRFEVSAHNGDGAWSRDEAAVALVVLPHFTETWWFRLGGWMGGVCAASAGVVLVVRRRNNLRFQEMERQRTMERERARIAQDLHDDLGANLTRIRFLGSIAARSSTPASDVPRYIEQMRSSAREMVIALDEIVWAVNPKNDSLRALVSYLCHFAEEFTHPTGIRCRLDVPDELPEKELASDVRHHLFLAFKEALNNSVRHSKAAEVHIRLRVIDQVGELVIRDDGSGFDPGGHPSAGNGIGNMRNRLQAAGGSFTLESAAGKGTVVSLRFPLS